MKSLTLFLGVLLCIVITQARHADNENERQPNRDQAEELLPAREHRAGPTRHRRKRWQMNYAYDYPAPPNPYYADRRDYDRNQELLPQILRLLDEISEYVKRPPPPPVPQPIYIPYPVPYPVQQNCTCNIRVTNDPNITKRFPEMEDTNQNWGISVTNEDEEVEDDGTDGARPISFEPIKPIRPVKKNPPPVEHGTSQSDVTSSQPKTIKVNKSAGACNAAILTCCSDPQQRACFTRFGCAMTYTRKNVCSHDSVNAAIEAFRMAYSPV